MRWIRYLPSLLRGGNLALLWSLSERPLKRSSPSFEIGRKDSIVHFSNGLTVNMETKVATLKTNAYPGMALKSLYYLDANNNFPSSMMIGVAAWML